MMKAKLIFGITVLNLCCCSVLSQVILFQSCPNVTVQQNFNISKYVGKWYEVEKYFAIFELGGRCVTATYGDNGNGTVSVLNSQVQGLFSTTRNISGYAARVGNAGDGKLKVYFPSLPIQFGGDYNVLETDYVNYSVVWSCTPIGFINFRFAWILTRDRFPSQEVLDKAYNVFSSNSISRRYLLKTTQTNCKN